jgi:hypothetical protein
MAAYRNAVIPKIVITNRAMLARLRHMVTTYGYYESQGEPLAEFVQKAGAHSTRVAGSMPSPTAMPRTEATIDSHRSNRIVPDWQSRMSFEGETADLLWIG